MKLFYKSKSHRGGFTLIELLVIIAIISLLSSVVLASLRGARDKAALAAIRENVATIQIQSALYYEDKKKYADQDISDKFDLDCVGIEEWQGSFFSDGTVHNALMQIVRLAKLDSGTLTQGTDKIFCEVYEDRWVYSLSLSNLNISNAKTFCLDSFGKKNIYPYIDPEGVALGDNGCY